MSDETKTVQDWVDSHCQYGSSEFADQIRTYRNRIVVREFDGTVFSFPQGGNGPRKFKNVFNWVLLDDGSAVGWNESPRAGWSFPRTGAATVTLYMDAFRAKGMLDDNDEPASAPSP